jgi:predicted DNA-binding protein (MmcQ/YjbR family)
MAIMNSDKSKDKLLERIRTICLAFPESKEVEAWGHPTFRAGKKMFAAFGDDPDKGPTLGMKVGFDRQDELLQDSRFYPTPYAARQGWVSICLGSKTNWSEIAGLLREAYRQVALKRMLAALDALS